MIKMFLNSYGFAGSKDLLLSLCPSWKYGMGWEALSFSVVVAFMSDMLGITPILLVGMFVAVIIETVTGSKASLKLGNKFESWRFSRCVVKVFIWVSLFFMFNAFGRDAAQREGIVWSMARWVYSLFQVTTMIYFVVEYATSIAENMAVLDGKPKDTYVTSLKDIFKTLVDAFKTKIKQK